MRWPRGLRAEISISFQLSQLSVVFFSYSILPTAGPPLAQTAGCVGRSSVVYVDASAGERGGRAGGWWERGLRATRGVVTCEWASFLRAVCVVVFVMLVCVCRACLYELGKCCLDLIYGLGNVINNALKRGGYRYHCRGRRCYRTCHCFPAVACYTHKPPSKEGSELKASEGGYPKPWQHNSIATLPHVQI